MARPVIDLTGQTFGYLRVLNLESSRVTPNGTSRSMWRCVCVCGQEIVAEGRKLNYLKVKSCGCQRFNMISLRTKERHRDRQRRGAP